MRRKVLTAAAVAVMLLVATRLGTALAQDAFKAGPEHQAMEPLAGTFNAKIKFWQEPGKPPSESEGVMVRKWIMGGRFLQEDFDGKFNGASFKGMGLMGYDLGKKKYLGTWIDSMSTGIAVMESTYDSKTKTFSGTMDEIDPMTGKKSKARDVVRLVSNDHQIQEMFSMPEGSAKEMKVMEIQYFRVKK